MLVRIVRMTFQPDRVDDFLDIFDASADQIRAFPGCRHLELWRDARYPNIFTTFSHWDDATHLDDYRRSDLFRLTWQKTKPLFAGPPGAHSYDRVRPPSA
jgi:quinol monooxygenase YgiN